MRGPAFRLRPTSGQAIQVEVVSTSVPLDAISLLDRLRRLESHAFWAMEHSIAALPRGILSRIQGYRQITDAVLLGLAAQRGGRLATFDTGMAALLADAQRHWVETIPV